MEDTTPETSTEAPIHSPSGTATRWRAFRRSPWFRRSLGAAILLFALAAPYQYWVQVEKRFMTVSEGRLYRSGSMSPEKMVETVREHGIRTVIDLRTPRRDVALEGEALASVGVRHLSIPSGITPEPEIVDEVMEELRKSENWPVLIHCKHGVGRSSLFEAFYRIEFEGWNHEEARKAAVWRSGLGSFGREDERGQMVLDYAPRYTSADANP
ncbi:MAG: hypothetical protein HKP27_07405 [Myxococcales bacterium]|nr:hypothetical protein [Myxococcales bacterium]